MCKKNLLENHIGEICVDAFRTSQCGSSSGQDEKSDQETSLSRIGLLQLAVGKTTSLTRIGRILFLIFILLYFKIFNYIFIINSI